MRCEARTLDDIRALGGNDAADERCFATAARISETNLALYRTFAQPIVRALVNSPLAEWMQQLHPLRLQYEFFSNANPMMAPVAAMAEQVRKRPQAGGRRQSVRRDAGERLPPDRRCARRVAATRTRRWRSGCSSRSTAQPTLQAAAGIDPADDASVAQGSARIRCIDELLQNRIAELKSRIPVGGLREAVIRALLYAGMTRAAVDERGFEVVRRIRRAHGDIPLSAFKALVREQFNMLLLDHEAALAAIPSMLPSDARDPARGTRPDQAGAGCAR